MLEVVIFVPSTKDKNKPISSTMFNRRKKETAKFLSNSFGGSTRIKAVGEFLSSGGDLIGENVSAVQSFAKVKDYTQARRKILAFLMKKKRQWGQESIGYYFNVEDSNEGLHFI